MMMTMMKFSLIQVEDDLLELKQVWLVNTAELMDIFPNEQHFDLDKRRQTFHHSLKEHHKISNIPKFRCEML